MKVISTSFEANNARGTVGFSGSTGTATNGSGTDLGSTDFGLADMELGILSSSSNDPAQHNVYMRYESLDYYAMDDWK